MRFEVPNFSLSKSGSTELSAFFSLALDAVERSDRGAKEPR